LADAVKINAFPVEAKTAWISDVEGLVWTEVMLLSPLEFVPLTYDGTTETDRELNVLAPHSKLYVAYLCAMIDFANGEYDRYQNSMVLFNSHFSEYMRWYANHYRPADGNFDYMGAYISAYGLAVQLGFKGTKEEWIASLKGEKGEDGIIGKDGVSPTVSTEAIEGGYRVTITDGSGPHVYELKNGEDGADGKNGSNGQDGADGADGVSPTITVTNIAGGHRVTVTDATGTKFFDVMNGQDGDGAGDMLASVYDTKGKETDVFLYVDGLMGDVETAVDEINTIVGGA